MHHANRLTQADQERVLNAMRRLDGSWRRLKRTHWAITLKVIGGVPGTGGTSGAYYLQKHMDAPLFPRLSVPWRNDGDA
jgi:tryptophan 2,3-dioxygenase